jgi:hypothetical protein
MDLPISLPSFINQQQSSIEAHIIDHCCSFNEISTIVSYTSKLRHLKYTNCLNNIQDKSLMKSMKLEVLTDLSIHIYSIKFDDFQKFIQNSLKLKKLNVTVQCQDIKYMDPFQWRASIPNIGGAINFNSLA